jgi:hypothetical protein
VIFFGIRLSRALIISSRCFGLRSTVRRHQRRYSRSTYLYSRPRQVPKDIKRPSARANASSRLRLSSSVKRGGLFVMDTAFIQKNPFMYLAEGVSVFFSGWGRKRKSILKHTRGCGEVGLGQMTTIAGTDYGIEL